MTKTMSKNNYTLVMLAVFASLLILCVESVFFFTGMIDSSIERFIYFLEVQLLCIYILIVISARIMFAWKNLYFFFLFTMAIFLLMRIFLDVFGISFAPFNYVTKWVHFYFSKDTSVKLLLYFSMSLITIHLGALLAYGSHSTSKKIELVHSKQLFKVGATLFLIMLPIFAFKLILQLKFVLTHGYTSVYTDLQSLALPFWMKGSGTLTLFAYSLILGSLPKKKYFIFFTVLFVLAKVSILLQGSRGGFIVSLLIAIWYYHKFYTQKDLALSKISLLGLGLIVLAQITVVLRGGGEFYFHDFARLLKFFLYEQGTSIQVPLYMIESSSAFAREGLPYVLYSFISIGVLAPVQDLATLESFNNLANHLTYFISPNAYLSGEGIGTSFLAELYELPLLIIPVILIALGYFIVAFDRGVKHQRWFLLLCYPLAYNVIWMPRGALLPNVNEVLPIVCVYLIFNLLKRQEAYESKS